MPEQDQRPRSPGLGIGEGLRRHAEILMDQQMWCLGRDIRHPEGNLLLRRGFQACRPPADTVGSTAYTMTLPHGPTLTLWGFGLCFGGDPRDGLVYLGRFQFRPTWRPEPELPHPAWDSTRLPRFQPPCDDDWGRVRRLTSGAMEALGEYEEWVVATLGLDHRRICVRSWSKLRTAPERIAPSWRSLARRVG